MNAIEPIRRKSALEGDRLWVCKFGRLIELGNQRDDFSHPSGGGDDRDLVGALVGGERHTQEAAAFHPLKGFRGWLSS